MALNFPDNPPNGQVFIADNGVEYSYNAANNSWTGSLEAGSRPIDPKPSNVTVNPAFDGGSGTEADPYIISPNIVDRAGGTAQSNQYITFTDGKQGDPIIFTNNTTPGNIAAKFNQDVGFIQPDGTYSTYLQYDDSLGSSTTSAVEYVGNLQVGDNSVYFRWKVDQEAASSMSVTANSVASVSTEPTPGNTITTTNPSVSGGTAPYTYTYQWQNSADNITYVNGGGSDPSLQSWTLTSGEIGYFYRCIVTVNDSGVYSPQSVTSTSNGINCVDIVCILDGYSAAPIPGDTLNASITISGNKVGYSVQSYQWYADGAAISGATGDSFFVTSSEIGKALSVKVIASAAGAVNIENTSSSTPKVVDDEDTQVETPEIIVPVSGAGMSYNVTLDEIIGVTGSVTTPTIALSGTTNLDKISNGALVQSSADYIAESDTITNVVNDSQSYTLFVVETTSATAFGSMPAGGDGASGTAYYTGYTGNAPYIYDILIPGGYGDYFCDIPRDAPSVGGGPTPMFDGDQSTYSTFYDPSFGYSCYRWKLKFPQLENALGVAVLGNYETGYDTTTVYMYDVNGNDIVGAAQSGAQRNIGPFKTLTSAFTLVNTPVDYLEFFNSDNTNVNVYGFYYTTQYFRSDEAADDVNNAYYDWQPVLASDSIVEQTKLTFSGNQNLSLYQVGDVTTTGATVKSIDPSALKIGLSSSFDDYKGSDSTGTGANTKMQIDYIKGSGTVSSISGSNVSLINAQNAHPYRFVPNVGINLRGQSGASASAKVAPDIVMESSTFKSLPKDTLDHASSSWEITTASTTGWDNSNPLYKSSINNTTNLTSWQPGLELSTIYKSRVKYKSSSGVESEWSNDNVFETELDKRPSASKPGNVWRIVGRPGTGVSNLDYNIKFLPSKAISYVTNAGDIFFVLADGSISQMPVDDNGQLAVTMPLGNDNVQIYPGQYNYTSENCMLILKNDGSLFNYDYQNNNSGTPGAFSLPNGEKGIKLHMFGADQKTCCIQSDANNFYAWGEPGYSIGSYEIQNWYTAEDVGIVLDKNNPQKPIDMAGGSDALQTIFWLSPDGYIFASNNTAINGGNEYPAMGLLVNNNPNKNARRVKSAITGLELADKFKEIGTITSVIPSLGSNTVYYGSMGGLTTDNRLFVGTDVKPVTPFATQNTVGSLAFQQIGTDTDWASIPVASNASAYWYALKQNGELWGSVNPYNISPLASYITGGSRDGWESLGYVAGIYNARNPISPFVIIPDSN